MAIHLSRSSQRLVEERSKGHSLESGKPKKEKGPVELLDSDKKFREFFDQVVTFLKKKGETDEVEILEGADPSDPDFDTKLAQFEDRVKLVHEKFGMAKVAIDAVKGQYRSILNRDFQNADIELAEDDPVLKTVDDELTKLAMEDFDPAIEDKDEHGNDVIYGTKKIQEMISEMQASQKMDAEIAQREKELKNELKKYGTSSEEVEVLVDTLKAAESKRKVEEEVTQTKAGTGSLLKRVFSLGKFGRPETEKVKVARELGVEELSDESKADLKSIMKDFGLTEMSQIADELAKVEKHLEDVKQLEEKRAQLRLKKKEVLQFGDKSGKIVKDFQGKLKAKLDTLLASGTPEDTAQAAKLHKAMVERGGTKKEEGPHYVAQVDKTKFTGLEKKTIKDFEDGIKAAVTGLDLTAENPGADLTEKIRELINGGGEERRGEFRQKALDELAKLNKEAVKAKENEKARYIKSVMVTVHKLPSW